jgi:hypothetical protein
MTAVMPQPLLSMAAVVLVPCLLAPVAVAFGVSGFANASTVSSSTRWRSRASPFSTSGP